MTTCKKCGAELADGARICRECGALQNTKSSGDDFFSMPYLSAEHTEKPPAEAARSETRIKDEPLTKEEQKQEKRRIEQITDPRERAFAKQDRRNKLIRIAALIAAIALVLCGVLYLLLRSTGYHRTLDRYVDGLSSNGGTQYLAIVPELYLLEAETLYGMSRPDIRSNTGGYLEYVEEQIAGDYGDDVRFSYKISSETTSDDTATTEALEESILSAYGTSLSISDVAYVSIRLTTEGSVTKTTETKSLTFFKTGGSWYSMDAMQVVQFACENSGYELW
ncbi:MAG: zinc ribbon domain-containing protein [Ruminococcus sp.]|nr:zinc ribbon domain-containing protein [Ruminococcus sp.]